MFQNSIYFYFRWIVEEYRCSATNLMSNGMHVQPGRITYWRHSCMSFACRFAFTSTKCTPWMLLLLIAGLFWTFLSLLILLFICVSIILLNYNFSIIPITGNVICTFLHTVYLALFPSLVLLFLLQLSLDGKCSAVTELRALTLHAFCAFRF